MAPGRRWAGVDELASPYSVRMPCLMLRWPPLATGPSRGSLPRRTEDGKRKRRPVAGRRRNLPEPTRLDSVQISGRTHGKADDDVGDSDNMKGTCLI